MRPRPTDPLVSFFAFPTRAAPTDRPAARSAAKEILGSGRSDRPTRPAVARAPARLGPTRPTDRLAPRLYRKTAGSENCYGVPWGDGDDEEEEEEEEAADLGED